MAYEDGGKEPWLLSWIIDNIIGRDGIETQSDKTVDLSSNTSNEEQRQSWKETMIGLIPIIYIILLYRFVLWCILTIESKDLM